MFKKFKDKLAEEMKQSPARLQASMQQLAQAVVSPALSNSSVQELSASNDNFSLTEEVDETPKNSPARHGFQDVDLISPISNAVGISRRSSVSSVTSDSSSLFPIYESPTNLYHFQSDMDQSASEIDENISSQLDKVSKDQIYSAYRKVQVKYQKYRGRYTDLAAHYKELERVKVKLESVLVETQDKVLRRIADLKEQCQLEQQAKAHLEEALRNDIEEKDHIINTLNTKIKLLQVNGPNIEAAVSDITNDYKENLKDNLIDLNTESTTSLSNDTLIMENTQLKDRLKKLENVVLKYKESLKRNKEKFTEVLLEKNGLESEFKSLKNSYADKERELNNVYTEIKGLSEKMVVLKKREEESIISLAENKLSIHRELEAKEEEIKRLQLDLKHVAESNDNLSEVVNKYKVELEKLKLVHTAENAELEKKDIYICKKKSEVQKFVHPEILQKSANSDDINLRLQYQGDDSENVEINTHTQDEQVYDGSKSKFDDEGIQRPKDSSIEKQLRQKMEELQKLTKEYQTNKDKLCTELSNAKLRCVELQNEQDAQKIITEERKKEAEASIEKLQATIQSLDKELENMRNALIDRDKVCENYKAKIQEYATLLEKEKEKLLARDTEIKILEEKVLLSNSEIFKLNDNIEKKNFELLHMQNELHSSVSIISNLNDKLGAYESNISELYEEKNKLIRNILNYKTCTHKLKEDSIYIKSKLGKHCTEFNHEISTLKDSFHAFMKINNVIQDNEAQKTKIKFKELEDLNHKCNKLQGELEYTTRLKSDVEADLEGCKRQLNEVLAKMERQSDVDAKNRKLIAEIDNLNFKLYDLRNIYKQVESLTVKTKSLEDINSSLSNEVHHLKAQLKEVTTDTNKFEELKQKHENAIETIRLLQSEHLNCNKLKEEVSTLQYEIQNLNKNLLEKDKEILNLKMEDESHSKLVKDYRVEITKMTDTNKTLEHTMQTKSTQLRKLKSIKQQQDITIQGLNDEIIEVKALNTKLSDQLEMLVREINALKLENCQILTLKNDYSVITSELNQLKLTYDEINLENKNLKDKQNEFLKHNQELMDANEKLRQNVTNYEDHNEKLSTENTQLSEEVELHKSRLNGHQQDIDKFKSEIRLLKLELESNATKLNNETKDLISYKKFAEEIKDCLTKENEDLAREVQKLTLVLKQNQDLEEQNQDLSMSLKILNKEVARLKIIEKDTANLKSEINHLKIEKINSEGKELENKELVNKHKSLLHKLVELENVNSVNTRLQSHVNNLETKISNLEQIERRNSELKNELDAVKSRNDELLCQMKTGNIEQTRLTTEINKLKHIVDEKVAELVLLDSRNMELLKEIERLKDSTIEQRIETEAETSEGTSQYLQETITKLQEEIKTLKESNNALKGQIQNVNSQSIDGSFTEDINGLYEQNKKLEAQLDEALITFQAKELQMQIANNELKSQADKLKEKLITSEEEQTMRLKQLVKEFQAQLQDKEEELHAALEKRFDRQQNYESNLIQQYKEQLKDFQVELTTKSEQIESLILENKSLMVQKAKDINQLIEEIAFIKKEHTDEVREIEKKWKSIVQQKADRLEAKHEEEINELTREWRNERRLDTQTDLLNKELESTSRVAMAAVQSNTGSFHTLQQTLTAQRRELAELRKLVKLRHDTLEDSTEIEYLRNILFEYMMGRETMVLARVIAAVVKFDQEQTAKILKKEEDKMTLVKKFNKSWPNEKGK